MNLSLGTRLSIFFAALTIMLVIANPASAHFLGSSPRLENLVQPATFLFQTGPIHYYVDAVNGNNVTGTGSLTSPWRTISFALSQISSSGIEMHVAAGVYNTALGETFPIVMKPEVSLKGAGYTQTVIAGNNTDPVIRFPASAIYTNTTILQGFKVISGSQGILLDGFTGSGSAPLIQDNWLTGNGYGVYIDTASGRKVYALIKNNLIANNANAGIYGIANYTLAHSSPIIENNQILNNGSDGIYCWAGASSGNTSHCNPQIKQNLIKNNGSAGIRCETYYAGNCGLQITANTIAQNVGWGVVRGHSGTYLVNSSPYLASNLIYGHSTGGASFHANDTPLLVNNTIVNNNSYGVQAFQATVVNSIIWGHSDDLNAALNLVSYSDVSEATYEGWQYTVSIDPQFVNSAQNDYHLQPTSPLIGAGTTHPNLPELDVDGTPRLVGGAVDIGADEETPHQLAIAQSVTPTLAGPGEVVTYTVTITNLAATIAADAAITDQLPLQMTWGGLVTATSGQVAVQQNQMTWRGSLQPFSSHTLIYNALLNANLPNNLAIPNTASLLRWRGVITETAPVTVTTRSGPVWALSTQVVNAQYVRPGQALTYTLQIKNSGNAAGINVQIINQINNQTTLALASDGGVLANGQVTWSAPTLAVGEVVTRTLVVTVNPGVANGTLIANNVYVTDQSGLEFYLSPISATTFVHDPGDSIVVYTLADTQANDGQCSLREAIIAANMDTASGSLPGECPAGSSDDVIDLTPLQGVISLTTLLPDIASNVVLQGPGRDKLTLDGHQTYRVLRITAGNVTLSGLTLANGYIGPNDGRGGGILNLSSGQVAVQDSTLLNNRAVGADGGNSYAGGPTGCCFGGGGGIFHNGPGGLTVTNTEFRGNMATGGNGGAGTNGTGGGGGGGAFGAGLFSNGGSTQVVSSTFATNYVYGGNGGNTQGGSSPYGGGGGGGQVDGLGAGGQGGGDGASGANGNLGGGGGGGSYYGTGGLGGTGAGNGGNGNAGGGGGGGGLGAAIFVNGGQTDVSNTTFTGNWGYGGLGGSGTSYGADGQGVGYAIFNRSVTNLNNNNIPNEAPVLGNFAPASGTTNVAVNPVLSWNAVDPDADQQLYGFGQMKITLAYGTNPNNLVAVSPVSSTFTFSQPLNYLTTYYWVVTATDQVSVTSSGLMSFTTRPKIVIDAYNPPHGAVKVPLNQTLWWHATQALGQPLSYTLAFGPAPGTLIQVNNATPPAIPPLELAYNKTYYWVITATDSTVVTSTGMLSFTTRGNVAPTFTTYIPTSGAVAVPLSQTLNWAATDGDNDPIEYRVAFGTNPTALVQLTNPVTPPIAPPTALAFGTTYYWTITATDKISITSSGLLSFTTAANSPPVLSNFNPAHNSNGVPIDQRLSWASFDPNGHQIRYKVGFGTNLAGLVETSNVISPFNPGLLNYATTYYWVITATDSLSATSSSGLLSFTTQGLNAASCGFNEGFESGPLGPYWTSEITAEGRININPDYPQSGSYSLLLDDSSPASQFSRAAAILTVNLKDSSAPHRLHFWWREFDDENHPEDGVFISSNGLAWYPVLSFNDGPATFREDVINLNAAAVAHGLNLNTPLKVKFQFYDDYPIFSDGYAIDDISIDCATNTGPSVSNFSPANNTNNISLSTSLSWTAADPDGDPLSYSVAFGTNPAALVQTSGLTLPVFSPAPLAGLTTYYWVITATDGLSSANSELLSFTTVPGPVCEPVTNAALTYQPQGTIFAGNWLFFTANAKGTKPFTHSWTINGYSGGSSTNVLNTSFPSPGTYTVAVNISNACTPIPVSKSVLIQVQTPGTNRPNLSASSLVASLARVRQDDILTYTLVLRNQSVITANNATVSSTIPTSYTQYIPGSASASDGSSVTANNSLISWHGPVISGTPVIIKYAVKVLVAPIGQEIISTASINDGFGETLQFHASSIYDPLFRLTVNHGQLYTNIPTVTLTLSWGATNPAINWMALSNDGGFGPGSQSRSVVENVSWTLSTYGNQVVPRTVYAIFFDGNGDDYGPIQDDIIYDPTRPELNVRRISLAQQAQLTNQQTSLIVRVSTLDDNSGVERVVFSDDPAFLSPATVTYPITASTQDFIWTRPGEVYVKVIDRAGNESIVRQVLSSDLYNVYLPLVVR